MNAIIYGGGGAVGGAVARTFAREGASVFLAGRTCETLESVAGGIEAAGGYTRIDPHERIDFVSNFADEDGTHIDPAAMGLPPGVPYEVPHVITFETVGEGRTEMTVTEYGYTTEQDRDLSKAGMEQCLDKMAAIFAG